MEGILLREGYQLLDEPSELLRLRQGGPDPVVLDEAGGLVP